MFDSLSERLQEIIHKTSSSATLTEENMSDALREIRRALLAADVSLNVVKSFISNIKEKAEGADVLRSVKPSEMLIKIVSDELTNLLGKENSPLKLDTNPSIIMMLGLQGSGKTTSSVKLALKLKKEGKKPLLVAMDIYRPAAINQLETLAKNTGVDFFSLSDSKDVCEIAKRALEFAKENNNTVLIFDTAGRLQIDTDMMAELLILDKTCKINEKLLVIDSMTGQEAIDIAKNFDEQLNITGVILTKLDGDSRGGCALSVVYSTGKPIKLIGTGEKISPLEEFHPDRMSGRILGMGDIVSLVEKAHLLGMLPIPGLNKDDRQKISHEGEKQFKKIEVMISSMTREERQNPDILNASRKKRIAKGSGVSLNELNAFLSQFETTRKMMKGFGELKNSFKGSNMRQQAKQKANLMARMKNNGGFPF